MTQRVSPFVALWLYFGMTAPAVATNSIYNMTLAELMKVKIVNIATGTSKTLNQAPAVASVITHQDIERMGAAHLNEVLSTIPGIFPSISGQMYMPKFVVRGITSKFNPETLLLVDGVPMTTVFRGDRHTVTPKIHVKAIERIEIIRGPGSARYGADAFAGVINIITKTYKKAAAGQFGADVGSYDSANVWAQTAFEWQDIKWFIGAEYSSTDGHGRTLKADAQTAMDSLGLSVPVSFAPGRVNVGYTSSNIQANAQWSDFRFKLSFTDVTDMGTGEGVAEALDPQGRYGSQKWIVALDYGHSPQVDTDINYNLSYFSTNQKVEMPPLLLPPGTFFGAFEQGMIGTPETWEYAIIAKTDIEYRGFDNHTMQLGFGFRRQDMYRVQERKNFDSSFSPYPQGLVDVSDTPEVFSPEAARNNYFVFAQDEYQLNQQLVLTTGIRFDHYTDFGSTTNPRLALVWQPQNHITTKLLYGRAFRAPAFVEQLIINNPVALGNPDIRPEVIDTYEAAINYQFTDNIQWDFNLYRFDLSDRIEFVRDANGLSATAQNVGSMRGYGFESELKIRLDNHWDIQLNYALQNTRRNATDTQLGGAPKAIINGLINWHGSDGFSMHLRLSHVTKQRRDRFDNRAPLKGYNDLSLFFDFGRLPDDWHVYLKLNNLFDQDIRHPSAGPADPSSFANIPDDLPQAGRHYAIGIKRAF